MLINCRLSFSITGLCNCIMLRLVFRHSLFKPSHDVSIVPRQQSVSLW
jgi:hypothetical protein